ncbi:hypothetical protein BJX68DRAFT_266391 [Aspergillus pseudodeflectus]|uniref:Uncharacterized protein n=1 Tax=Aspergillus pseudodeflectus TaxID=176178 RepID=A0ABR4KEV9_9EURO
MTPTFSTIVAPILAVAGSALALPSNGSEWKTLRKRFNPGFAPQHLISLLPGILDRVQCFTDILDGHARSGEVFALDEPCINLTFDIIGTVSMDTDLHAQGNPGAQSPIVTTFRRLVSLYRTSGSASWDQFKLRTKFQRRRLARQLDAMLRQLTARSACGVRLNVSPLKKRFDLTCQDNGGGYRPVGEVQACVNYLFNKGTTHCVVDGNNVIFCRAGNTVITGATSVVGQAQAPIGSVDVAWGAQDIINARTTPDGWVGGAAAARGNGGLVVAINWG